MHNILYPKARRYLNSYLEVYRVKAPKWVSPDIPVKSAFKKVARFFYLFRNKDFVIANDFVTDVTPDDVESFIQVFQVQGDAIF